MFDGMERSVLIGAFTKGHMIAVYICKGQGSLLSTWIISNPSVELGSYLPMLGLNLKHIS